MKKCRVCGTMLRVGHNWSPSFAKTWNYLCQPCNASRQSGYYQKLRGDPAMMVRLREKGRESYYRQHRANPERMRERERAYYKRNRARIRARKNAQRMHFKPVGVIYDPVLAPTLRALRAQPCSVCGNPIAGHIHHKFYGKYPLDGVMPICRACHGRAHATKGRKGFHSIS